MNSVSNHENYQQKSLSSVVSQIYEIQINNYNLLMDDGLLGKLVRITCLNTSVSQAV